MLSRPNKSTLVFVCTKARGGLNHDDQLLADELLNRGFDIEISFWDDKDDHKKLSNRKIYINRATFDYYKDINLFNKWLDKLESLQINIFNNVDIMRHYSDKSYLCEMKNAVPSMLVRPRYVSFENTLENIKDFFSQHGVSREMVLKPTFGAGGFETYKCHTDEDEELRRIYDHFKFKNIDLLIQPFIQTVKTVGEFSLIYFSGIYSHGYLSVPDNSDFRIHSQYGGTYKQLHKLDPDLENFANDLLADLDETPLISRIDAFETENGFMLSELEVVEPYLSFADSPCATKLLANALEEAIYGSEDIKLPA